MSRPPSSGTLYSALDCGVGSSMEVDRNAKSKVGDAIMQFFKGYEQFKEKVIVIKTENNEGK
eukprot:6341689-Ditylum_brightwellii.AAC.1